MVWPNRGAIGAIGGYGLNVLNLLQGSHRCCRYVPAAAFKKVRKTNQASPSAIVPILYRGPEKAGPLIPSGYQGIPRQVALTVGSEFLYP